MTPEEAALNDLSAALAGFYDIGEAQRGKPYLDWLREDCHYIAPIRIGKYWVACEQLLFHGSLIGGDWGDYCSVRWRYCYPSVPAAARAMVDWIAGNCMGEPEGWHKRRSKPMLIGAGALS